MGIGSRNDLNLQAFRVRDLTAGVFGCFGVLRGGLRADRDVNCNFCNFSFVSWLLRCM